MREREHRSWHIQRGLPAAVLAAVVLAWGLVAAPGSGPSGGGGPEIASVVPESGPVGTAVVVRGENFGSASGVAQGTSGVSIGGVWGTPSYWSDREIRVPVPSGAPGGLVVVATGGLAGNGVPFRVTGPAPVIASVDPNHGPAGTEVVIRGTHFGSPMAAVQGAGRVSFNGTAGRPTYWSDRGFPSNAFGSLKRSNRDRYPADADRALHT